MRTVSHIREAVEGAGTVAEGTGSASADVQITCPVKSGVCRLRRGRLLGFYLGSTTDHGAVVSNLRREGTQQKEKGRYSILEQPPPQHLSESQILL